MHITLLRLPDVCARTGRKRPTVYRDIKNGLFVPPVRIGASSCWIDSEINAVIAAQIRGVNDDELRELVRSLVAARATAGVEAGAVS